MSSSELEPITASTAGEPGDPPPLDADALARQIRVLRRAVALSGGRGELAQVLGVSTEDISEWLSGIAALPDDSYTAAADVAFSDARRKRPAMRRAAKPRA